MSRVLDGVESVRPRVDLDQVYRERIDALPPPAGPPVLERFRDLLYPRRAYFERTRPVAEEAPVPHRPAEGPDLYLRLAGMLESGPVGDIARLPPRTEEPAEEVPGFRGAPFLLRTSRAWEAISPDALVRRAPQYALELGYRCAVTGVGYGRIVLGYERASEPLDRVDILEVRFLSVTPFARRVRQGQEGLARALAQHRPEDLAPCPEWMFADCAYAAECACGASPDRSQR